MKISDIIFYKNRGLQLKIVVILLLSLTNTSCRKDQLHWQKVEHLSIAAITQLNSALFVDAQKGILVGGGRFEDAKIWYSADGGSSWQPSSISFGSKGLFGLCSSPNQSIYASGMYMQISKAEQWGNSFRNAAINNREEFVAAISFGQSAMGVAVTALGTDSGAVIIVDSALQMQSFRRFKHALWDIKMLDAAKGFAVGSGVILQTKDSGKNWTNSGMQGDNFKSISCLDDNNIMVCGLSGTIVKSNDGGKSWKKLRNGSNLTLPHYQLWDIYWLNKSEAFAVGEKGLVIFSDDAGEHWSEFVPFTQNNLRFICPNGSGKLLVGGENGALFLLQP